MTNQELHFELVQKAKEETLLTQKIIELVADADRRKLFRDWDCTSLFVYLTKHVKMQHSSAQRHIDGARLYQVVPELAGKIGEGIISMNQVIVVQKMCRAQKNMSPETKKLIIEKIEHKSSRETELILAKEFDLPIVTQEKEKIQKDESVYVTFTLTKEEKEILAHAKDLLSHTLPNASAKDFLLHFAKKTIKQKTQPTVSVIAPPQQKPGRRPIPANVRRYIFQRDKVCQICGSRRFLEVDHIIPVSQKGTNAIENLRLLCDFHNRHR